MPVNDITIFLSSQAPITKSSLTEPPGWQMYETPLFAARSILSLNGKKASLPKVTPLIFESTAFKN